MRRWLSLLLLFVVPLLSSWSAVAAYCEHAPDSQVRHFGHHPHQHADDEASDTAAVSLDVECDHCHTPGATLAFFYGTTSRADNGRPASHLDAPLRLRPPALPDRPNWVGLA